MPNLTPGASWDGTTTWQGRAVPAAATGLQGSGWPHKAIGAFNRAPHMWWTADFNLVVGTEHGDDDWIEEVTFWLEGNTVTVDTVTKDTETGDIGFVVTIQPPSGTDGDAELYAIIKPVNGYQRRIGPLPMVFNKGSSITRQVRYIATDGNDGTGDGTQGAPWRSVLKACLSAGSGDIVEMAAGEYLEDSNSAAFPNSNERLIEFRKAPGLDVDDVWITRTSRTTEQGNWRFGAKRVLFDAITIKLENIVTIYPRDEGLCIFKDCELLHADGAAGPAAGYWNGGTIKEFTQILMRHEEGQQNCLLNCRVENYTVTGWYLCHHCTIEVSADSAFFTSARASSGASIWDTQVSQLSEFYAREHSEPSLTVDHVVVDTSDMNNPISTVYWTAGTLTNYSSSTDPNRRLRMLDGNLAGQTFELKSQDNTTKTTTVKGDMTGVESPDTGRVSTTFHADSFQTARPLVLLHEQAFENMQTQRVRSISAEARPPSRFVLADTDDPTPVWRLKPLVNAGIWVEHFGDPANNGWFTITGVTDSTITVAETLVDEADDVNAKITGPGEPPIENVFAQRYWAVGITFQPMFLQRDAWESESGVTVSATGTTATFPRAHGLVSGDLLRITSGIAAGRARTVRLVNSATQVTLSEQFDKAVSNAAYAIGKSVKDIGLQLCILDNTGDNVIQTQWGCCMSHVVMRRCTHLGSLFHVRDGLPEPEYGAHGVVVTDCIFEEMRGDGSGSAIPSDGIRVDNSVFEKTPNQGTNPISGNGAGTTVDGTTYRPPLNSVANGELTDARNYLGYDYYGQVTNTSSSNGPVGAAVLPDS